jgi:FtsH-binding integral membrane protein
MSYGSDFAASHPVTSERAAFIRRVYAHLAGAILAFIGLEAVLVNTIPMETVFKTFFSSPYTWLLVMGAFWGVSWLAQTWAQSDTSEGIQYLGLGLYIVAEAVIFLPILMIAINLIPNKDGTLPNTTIIPTAGILTLAVFGGLTFAVFITRKDYSFLGPILCVGGWIALGLIVASILVGFSLGLFFCFAMVALLSGCILFQTSKVLLHYPTNKHVAASLLLFSAVATLFYYILYILMLLSDRR